MQHQIRRWNHDHTSELHVAWMNGSGMMIWENVFGSWAGWSPRDRSILRSMLPIQRRYSEVFAGEDWSPLVATDMPDVYASQWNHGQQRLWTLVNRAAETREGVLLSVPHTKGSHYFDLVHGREINVTAGDAVKLSGSIRPRGIACFLASPTASLGKDFAHFTAAQAQIELRADFGADSPVRPVSLRSASSAKPKTAAPPADMAAIGPVAYDMRVELRARETGYYTGQEYAVGKGYAPETPPAPGAPLFGVVHVTRKVNLNRYAIGLTPVTNAQYADFLHASGYRPKLAEKFLNHWADGAPPAALRDHPVVYVDLEDARAYATWAGKRLPSEEEWQYAAQGPEGRRYPWGDAMRPGVCNGGETKGTTAVTAFPDGRSAFGCYDLCGNVWEWTESERTDGRTRFAMIRGGSYYEAKGSHWYMDGGPQPCNFAAKVLLMWPGLDRCSTIGFRCAVDL
jgi:formylglycine-generating enzyme required for sulfatase activity